MHPLLQHLNGRLHGLPRATRVLAAVSGGADSMALLRGLLELPVASAFPVHVAHLDHQLRGVASTADADWLKATCHSLGVPITIGRIDVASAATATGDGIEAAARQARYTFLEETARGAGCSVIALAHTADDQAETILHHILRGTGLAGLRGIPPERELAPGIRLMRPLLDLSRQQVLDFLQTLGQTFREDESNHDDVYTRNRIRLQLLPALARDYNPQIAESLRRLGLQAAEAQQTLEYLAESQLDRVLESATPHQCELKWQPLTAVPRHLLRELFAALWRRQHWPRQQMGFAQWDELAELTVHGGTTTLPGRISVRREGRLLTLHRPPATHTANPPL
ncbi:MAG: tRNA lysidine(34) synthetase TilS [Planctomycetes bacterium]|nr:tRNA lysidine(34) synthetase TilS [Planctomycetota bacterium]